MKWRAQIVVNHFKTKTESSSQPIMCLLSILKLINEKQKKTYHISYWNLKWQPPNGVADRVNNLHVKFISMPDEKISRRIDTREKKV